MHFTLINILEYEKRKEINFYYRLFKLIKYKRNFRIKLATQFQEIDEIVSTKAWHMKKKILKRKKLNIDRIERKKKNLSLFTI